jgi:hypothetical protein
MPGHQQGMKPPARRVQQFEIICRRAAWSQPGVGMKLVLGCLAILSGAGLGFGSEDVGLKMV